MDVSAETLRRHNFGNAGAGDRVNLERCLTLDKLPAADTWFRATSTGSAEIVAIDARRRLEAVHV